MATTIPIVDFAKYGVKLDSDIGKVDNIEALASEVITPLKNIGFVYIINHGIPQTQIDELRRCGGTFLSLPEEVKSRYARVGNSSHGWIGLEQESLNCEERPADYKETFNVNVHQAKVWPDDVVPGLKKTFGDFYATCFQLALHILDLMAIGLKLEDINVFKKIHKLESPSYTTLRCANYPAIPEHYVVKPAQIRCGEHSDYNSITLLFQDETAGLEVLTRQGAYVETVPVEGAVLLNVGDLMQRWTSDELVATKHRVLMPEDEALRRRERRSIALFVHPEDDCVVRPLDGSDKYPPINAYEYTYVKFKPSH